MDSFLSEVKIQYEKHPYPPISPLALPLPSEGKSLLYETVSTEPHDGKRILVVGCGTLEPLIVAQAHPNASEIVSCDISHKSISKIKQRIRLAKLVGRKLPPLTFLNEDFRDFSGFHGEFDYILASNVLHHTADPAASLSMLSTQLRSGAILRMVTYPKQSRLWMRETSNWLRKKGLSEKTHYLSKYAAELIKNLPVEHPFRTTFQSHQEIKTDTGIIDAFFHNCENPISFSDWKAAVETAELKLIKEGQAETSQSQHLDLLCGEVLDLDAWTKLQILDDLLELCANPVLWLRKDTGSTANPLLNQKDIFSKISIEVNNRSIFTPELFRQVLEGLHRTIGVFGRLANGDKLFRKTIASLKKQGPRKLGDTELPGLSLLEQMEINFSN